MTGTGRWRGDLVVLLKTAIFLWGRAVGRMPAKEQAMIERIGMRGACRVAFVAIGLLGCGAGSVGKAIRPDDPSYANATGADGKPAAICRTVDAEARAIA